MGFFTHDSSNKLNWEHITDIEQLRSVFHDDSNSYQVFFKHSTRCSISSMVLNQLEGAWKLTDSDCQLFFIDLIAHREASNLLSEWTEVAHQSPQLIVVKNQQVIYHASHGAIDADKVQQIVKENE